MVSKMMMMIFYYLASASAVLFYGIGIHKSISDGSSFSSASLTCFKALFSAGATTAVSYIIISGLLFPVNLAELYPFVAALVFVLFTNLTEIFIGIGLRQTPVEFSIPLLSVFLGLNEGIGIGAAVVISCMCILSFYGMTFIFHCVRERISFYATERGIKTYCVLLLCLALVMISVCGIDSSWLTVYSGGVR